MMMMMMTTTMMIVQNSSSSSSSSSRSTTTDDVMSDMEKLSKAISELTVSFGSVDNFLEAMGLAQLPTAQRYGIMFGCLTFTLTITAVLTLLFLGGSFSRIVEQSQTGTNTIPHSYQARSDRPLLLERLLESRKRMIEQYHPSKENNNNNNNNNNNEKKKKKDNDEEKDTTNGSPVVLFATPLTKMLLNVAPIDTDTTNTNSNDKENTNNRIVPPNYEENYVTAYRKCQEKPGGAALSGRPEARFEAYSRAYAGCGNDTMLSYRRSYARMYEAVACASHESDDFFVKLWKTRPQDIVGRYVRLQPFSMEQHAQAFYDITCGDVHLDHSSFDPNEVWSFLPNGPFKTCEQMKKHCCIFNNTSHAAATTALFAIITNVTNQFVGVIAVTNDDPYNLSIQLEPPIIPPYKDDTREQMEPAFLLLDRLFAHGYRRIQFSTDSHDQTNRKLASRLGFTLEGHLFKHKIVKEANRDSHIFALLNSDWDKGARFALYKKLYGEQAAKQDLATRKKEEEVDVQTQFLKEQQQQDQQQDQQQQQQPSMTKVEKDINNDKKHV